MHEYVKISSKKYWYIFKSSLEGSLKICVFFGEGRPKPNTYNYSLSNKSIDVFDPKMPSRSVLTPQGSSVCLTRLLMISIFTSSGTASPLNTPVFLHFQTLQHVISIVDGQSELIQDPCLNLRFNKIQSFKLKEKKLLYRPGDRRHIQTSLAASQSLIAWMASSIPPPQWLQATFIVNLFLHLS